MKLNCTYSSRCPVQEREVRNSSDHHWHRKAEPYYFASVGNRSCPSSQDSLHNQLVIKSC